MASRESEIARTSPKYSSIQGKHCCTRRLHPIPEDIRSWLSTFPDTMIQWMCPWWRLQHVMLRSYTYYVPIASLHLTTFYNPSQLCMQFGQKQLIMGPVHEFGSGPLSQNCVDNLTRTWPRRTIMRQIDYNGDLSTDDQYKNWIQLQQNERNTFLVSKRTRELQASRAR